jgi:threonine/homoserine/homoserine lactone efflux protein
MEFLKYKMVKLLLIALVLALLAFPFDETGFIFMFLRLISFAIFMYVLIKLTSAKKKEKK